MMVWILVALGGAIGTLLRFGVTKLSVPYMGNTYTGTFLVNVTGSLLLGVFIGWSLTKSTDLNYLRHFIAIGILGGYTTFSTLTLESLQLLETGSLSKAGLNIIANMTIGLLSAYAGFQLGRTI
ncbi:MAG: hypothetical protein CL886_09695 [Dehalococcoidia bacterium]|nr:hypothetical protein [Dehalococcoidia bacterium]